MRLLGHAPYRHWIAGFLFELAVFAAFIVLVSLAAIAIAYLLA